MGERRYRVDGQEQNEPAVGVPERAAADIDVANFKDIEPLGPFPVLP